MTNSADTQVDENMYEAYSSMSPSKLINRDNIRLGYEAVQHKSRAYKDPKEMWAFASKVEDLMFRLLRYTPKDIRENLEAHYKEMEDKIANIEEERVDLDKKEKKQLQIRFDYAIPVHQHNIKLLPVSSITTQDVEGELDVSKDEVVEIIRGGKRDDSTKIRFIR